MSPDRRLSYYRPAYLLMLLSLHVQQRPIQAADANAAPERIVFWSCCKQDQPQPIWDSIVAARPNLFLMIGDNIYGDSSDMSVLKSKWDKLGAQTGFKQLKQTCPILATWDDHDYGGDDAGAEFSKKKGFATAIPRLLRRTCGHATT